jgi:hypothetical protein
MSDPTSTEPTPITAPPPTTAPEPAATAEPAAAATAEPAAAADGVARVKATIGHGLDEAKATARKLWTDARQLGERARAEATKVTTRGRERWSVLAPRAKALSERARSRVVTVWTEQVAGARAGLARVRAVLGKRPS